LRSAVGANPLVEERRRRVSKPSDENVLVRSPWTPRLPLETDRLIIRAHTPDDLEDLLVFHADAEVTRYIPWPVRTREQTVEALAKKLVSATAPAPGRWLDLAIEERATGTVIGGVVLKREPGTDAEIGYVLRRDRWGQGLATEAVVALIEEARTRFGVSRFTAVVEAPNAASIRLLERLGFVPDGEEEAGVPRFALTES
jgi:RimJ/RimL family protein N-acetyltransferase